MLKKFYVLVCLSLVLCGCDSSNNIVLESNTDTNSDEIEYTEDAELYNKKEEKINTLGESMSDTYNDFEKSINLLYSGVSSRAELLVEDENTTYELSDFLITFNANTKLSHVSSSNGEYLIIYEYNNPDNAIHIGLYDRSVNEEGYNDIFDAQQLFTDNSGKVYYESTPDTKSYKCIAYPLFGKFIIFDAHGDFTLDNVKIAYKI